VKHEIWLNIKNIFFSSIQQAFNDYYNNEHTRLLKMWKEVVSVKRLFREISSTTKMDLSKIRCEIVGATREAAGACSGVLVQTKNSLKLDVKIKFSRNTNVKISKNLSFIISRNPYINKMKRKFLI
jgi:hypothetical protein